MLDMVSIISDTAKDDNDIDIETNGYTPLVGDFICMQENAKITQAEVDVVTPIAGNQYTITVHEPLDYPYTTNGGCMLMNVDMNINGSVTPVDFRVQPIPGNKWDITRMTVSMILGTAGDDGLFGNLAALPIGMFFRKENALGSQNLFAAKDNSDFRLEGYDTSYQLRSGGSGSYGMASRITYAGQSKSGVVIRLDGDSAEKYRATVNDNLTGLNKFRIKVQGHVVDD
jgi:hypothetical protein